MTEALAPSAKSSNVASSTPDTMEWDSRARRMVMIYLPLSCFVLILLFPFYWMAITSFKPNAELLDYKTHNPFWISSPTLAFQRGIAGGELGEGAAIAVSMIPFLVFATLFSYFGLARRKWQQGESND